MRKFLERSVYVIGTLGIVYMVGYVLVWVFKCGVAPWL